MLFATVQAGLDGPHDQINISLFFPFFPRPSAHFVSFSHLVYAHAHPILSDPLIRQSLTPFVDAYIYMRLCRHQQRGR